MKTSKFQKKTWRGTRKLHQLIKWLLQSQHARKKPAMVGFYNLRAGEADSWQLNLTHELQIPEKVSQKTKSGLEWWLSRQEHWLHFQRIRSGFSSWCLLTSVPRDPVPTSGLCRYYTNTHKGKTPKHIKKEGNKEEREGGKTAWKSNVFLENYR